MPEGEKKLIERIRRQARVGTGIGARTRLIAGIGDDAAILRLPPDHDVLVTTDFSIENIHFRRDWHPPEVVGWRCLTRGLSDIAAMGGDPIAAFLSLGVASDTPQSWIDQFVKGLLALARRFNVPLAGGDTANSVEGIQADIVVIGAVPKGNAILRSGAKPGDRIYVTGALGGAAEALARLRDSLPLGAESDRYFRPVPRIAVGQWLRKRKLPSAMIDISDGLSTDLDHICRESGVGAEIEAALIPRAPRERKNKRGGKNREEVALDLALHGGDEYELVFTSSKRLPKEITGVQITRIGSITRRRGMRLIAHSGKKTTLAAEGWEHFRGPR